MTSAAVAETNGTSELEELTERLKAVTAESERRDRLQQNELAIVKSKLAVREEKLQTAVRQIEAAKAASRASLDAHMAKLSEQRDAVSSLSRRLAEREAELGDDFAALRRDFEGAFKALQQGAADRSAAAEAAFATLARQAEIGRAELRAARDARAKAETELEAATEGKNALVARSNSLQRTLESLKHDLGKTTRESEKQRLASQRLRMTLTEAIDDRDRAIAAKDEWREIVSQTNSVDKLDKASAKEHELRRIISKLTFSLQEKDIQLDAQRATAKALQTELMSPNRG